MNKIIFIFTHALVQYYLQNSLHTVILILEYIFIFYLTQIYYHSPNVTYQLKLIPKVIFIIPVIWRVHTATKIILTYYTKPQVSTCLYFITCSSMHYLLEEEASLQKFEPFSVWHGNSRSIFSLFYMPNTYNCILPLEVWEYIWVLLFRTYITIYNFFMENFLSSTCNCPYYVVT